MVPMLHKYVKCLQKVAYLLCI